MKRTIWVMSLFLLAMTAGCTSSASLKADPQQRVSAVAEETNAKKQERLARQERLELFSRKATSQRVMAKSSMHFTFY